MKFKNEKILEFSGVLISADRGKISANARPDAAHDTCPIRMKIKVTIDVY